MEQVKGRLEIAGAIENMAETVDRVGVDAWQRPRQPGAVDIAEWQPLQSQARGKGSATRGTQDNLLEGVDRGGTIAAGADRHTFLPPLLHQPAHGLFLAAGGGVGQFPGPNTAPGGPPKRKAAGC